MNARRPLGLLALPVALAVSAGPAWAVSTWLGGLSPSPSSMSNPSNWSGGTPVSGSAGLALVFPASSGSFNPAQDLANPLILQSLTVNNSYTFTGNGFRFANLGANPTFTSTAGFLSLSNAIDFASPTTIGGLNQLELRGALTGTGDVLFNTTSNRNVTIDGTGSNSYSGTMTADGSGVQLNLSQSAGAATSGSIIVDHSAQLYTNVPAQFGVNSDMTIDNGGIWYGAANQTLRNLTVNGPGSAALSSTLTLTGSIASSSGAGQIGGYSNSALDLNGNQTTINVTSTGANELLVLNLNSITNGRFNKTGPGVLQLFAYTHAYSGVNTITAGTLRTAPDYMGTVVNNGTLELFGGTFNSDQVSGPGVVRLLGFVQYNAAQTFTGPTQLASGSTAVGSAATLIGNFNGEAGAFSNSVILNQPSAATFNGTLTGDIAVVTKNGTGTLTLNGGNTYVGVTQLDDGGLRVTSDSSIGSGTLQFTGANTTFEAVGTRTFSHVVSLQNDANFIGAGNVTFTDTTAKVTGSKITHASTGNTTINGKLTVNSVGEIDVTAGHLTVGNPALVGGFLSQGPVSVSSGGTLTVRSLNFVTLPDVTLAGGTLDAPAGYAIPLGAVLQGNGAVTGRVASANGSTIHASGNLALGDGTNVAGVNLDGELYTNQFAVTLLDSNQAVVGSLTQLGTASANGSLVATNGIVVNFGRNIAGRGQISSGNTLAQAVIMNGDASGDSPTNYLEFTGYVKGVGSFNNVAFSGTFAPGLSPALLTVGSIVFTPANVLDMELGGLNRGSQYDGIDATTNLGLGGVLKLSLINSFTPAIGNQFNLFDGPMTGTFSSYNFPALPSGVWDTSLLYSQGIVQVVVPEPTTLAALVLGGSFLRRRRR